MDDCPIDEFELKLLIESCDIAGKQHTTLGINDMKIRHYPRLKQKLEKMLRIREQHYVNGR